MSSEITGWTVECKGEAPTKEEAIALFEKELEILRATKFEQQSYGGFETETMHKFSRCVWPLQKELNGNELARIRALRIQAPFSDNYCRDWTLYHGGWFLIGTVVTTGGFLINSQMTAIVGIALMTAVLVAGFLNFSIDRKFRRR